MESLSRADEEQPALRFDRCRQTPGACLNQGTTADIIRRPRHVTHRGEGIHPLAMPRVAHTAQSTTLGLLSRTRLLSRAFGTDRAIVHGVLKLGSTSERHQRKEAFVYGLALTRRRSIRRVS